MKDKKLTITEEIDIKKYGFSLKKEGQLGTLFYSKRFGDYEIEILIAENIYSIFETYRGEEQIIANRYKIENQNQFDFLLLNSRVGIFFKIDHALNADKAKTEKNISTILSIKRDKLFKRVEDGKEKKYELIK